MNVGKIKQVIGSVLDISFEGAELPEIYNALEIEVQKDGGVEKIIAEVQQHLGDNTVSAVALSSTDGMVRGMKVVDTGAAIQVPVGEPTLGRIFNVLGNTVDEMGPVQVKEEGQFTVTLLLMKNSSPKQRFSKPELRLSTYWLLISKGEKPVSLVVREWEKLLSSWN